MLYADDEFIDETVQQYGYTVPLNTLSIEWGLVIALGLTLVVDLGLFGCVKCAGLFRRKHKRHPHGSLKP